MIKNVGSNRASKERLPEIPVQQKHMMFQSRCEKLIYQKIPKFDAMNLKNIFEVGEYAEDIHSSMKALESKTLALPAYMKKQTDINESMRAILVDWLIDVHLKFKLLSETLFITVNLIDRYLSLKQTISRSKL